jgi:methyltransferase (TIGR00027 family)
MVHGHDNILTMGEPSRTAVYVAMLRAAHRLLDEPIVFDDPLALIVLEPVARAELLDNPFQHNDPISRGERATLIVRNRFAEDELARAYAEGVRQYVVLGAGLDTFAHRNPFEDLRVFEVDHPSTQRWKLRRLEEEGISSPASLTSVPVDFEKDDLAASLATSGFREDLPSFFSWLGVTMYLAEPTVMASLAYVAGLAGGATVIFDYRSNSALLNAVQRAFAEVLAQRVANLGEPWVSCFDPMALRDQLITLGFGQVEMFDPDELNRRYLYYRKDGLRCGGRIMRAQV